MQIPQASLERAFDALLARVRRDPLLALEFEATRREFLARPAGAGSAHAAEMAERRHAEWFLLERPSDALDVVPALSLELEAAAGETGEPFDDGREALLGSFASVFEITGVRSGEGVWVRDLAGHGEYPLEEADASRALETGDLLVGRIFPVGDALYRISHASGFFRDPRLLAAVRLDLDRARDGRRGVLRLSQRDLETMFFSDQTASGELHASEQRTVRRAAIEAARRCLESGGLSPSDVDDVLAELASEPFDPEAVLPGAGDRLGQILATLAFETDVDLEAARRALATAWPELSRAETPELDERPQARAPQRPAGRGADPGARRGAGRAAERAASEPELNGAADPGRVERALSEFDARRARGEDLESVFADLERALELEADTTAEDATAPDFPGVVGAMVVEFLWEIERERGADTARRLAAIANFAQFAESQGVFENLSERDLLLYACLWLPEHAPSADEARRWLEALVEFCAWAEERQGVALATALERSRAGLAASLPRICAANAFLRSRRGAPSAGGDMLGYEGAGVARSSRGEARAVVVEPDADALLRAGDFLRVQQDAAGRAVVVCCYPPQTDRLADL